MQNQDNFIKTYTNVIPKAVCEYFINFFEKEDKLGNTHAGVIGTQIKNTSFKDSQDLNLLINYKKEIRYNSPEHLQNCNEFIDIVYEKFTEYIIDYNPPELDTTYNQLLKNSKPFFVNSEISGGPLMKRYNPPNQGYHTWHCDWAPSIRTLNHKAANRMLVGMVYLNDVKDGGETEFYYQKLKIKPKRGTLVIWPAYFTHLHRGNKPISNSKYIINMWANPTA